MHPLLSRLTELWNGLEARERRLLRIGAVLLALVLLYTGLLVPIQVELRRLRSAVPEARHQLAEMRAQAAAVQPLRGRQARPPAPGTLVPIVEQSASARGLRASITRLEPDGSNGLRLAVEAIPFNGLLAWLADLQNEHALLVESVQLDAATAGAVSGRVNLRVSGP